MLIERKIPGSRIVYIDKESLEFESIANYRDLNKTAQKAQTGKSGKTFLIVDEIQEIAGWERAVASLLGGGNVDIYISGSNASLFSSELSTLLSGRYVEFPVYPLSLREYLIFRGVETGKARAEFQGYLRFGGLPGIHHFDLTEETVFQYVNAVYNTILLKDVIRRHEIRNVPLLENIVRYVFDNVGNLFSARKIAAYLKSQRLNVGVETVQNYVGFLMDAAIIHKVRRYDVKGKRHLELREKYYLNDIGMRHALLGFREGDVGGLLENLVFMELKSRGYAVSVGQWNGVEVDFVAVREQEKAYIQVAYLLESPKTVKRELLALQGIADNYPKYILSMDTAFGDDLEGIRRLNLVDFLMKGLPPVRN
jgi:hypothetical protein